MFASVDVNNNEMLITDQLDITGNGYEVAMA